jgi:DNA-binding Lrp family transcriptional regulator
MAIGYVLITTRPTKEVTVYNTLKNFSEVSEIHPLFGEYDIIAKINTPDTNDVGHLVTDKIRSIEGIKDTKTLISITF